MTSPNFIEEELAFDRFVDQGILDADEAAVKSGYRGDGSNADFSAEAISARLGNVQVDPEDDYDDSEPADTAGFMGKNACWDCLVELNPGEECDGGHVTITQSGKLVIHD